MREYKVVLFSLLSLFSVVAGGFLLLALTRRIHDWSHRRLVQCTILLLPVVFLAVTLCALPLATRGTFLDHLVFFSVSGLALGALLPGSMRVILMMRFVARHALFINVELQEQVNVLAKQLGVVPPRVRLYPADQPAALTCGIHQPTILLSTWIVQHLDQHEIEAVLVHEMEHVVRHDYAILWLATILRDAFCYIPASQIAYRQLKREKELACDDLAVSVTQRPLALASALTRFWLHAAELPKEPRVVAAQSLVAAQEAIHVRVERLLASPSRPGNREHVSLDNPVPEPTPLLPFLFLQGFGLFLLTMVALMGCNGVMLLERFL